MVLIRRLLQDAQSKFRKMVEENKQLALRIDGSIQSASQEVHALRAELADTNKRLSQISTSGEEAEGEVEDKGGGGGGGQGYVGGVGGGGGVRPGLKETDIDQCCGVGSANGVLLSNGGGGGGGSGGGGDRTLDGEEKTDANKEEVTSERTESEACQDSASQEECGSVGTGL